LTALDPLPLQNGQNLAKETEPVGTKDEAHAGQGLKVDRIERELLETQLMHVVLRSLPLQLDNTLIATS